MPEDKKVTDAELNKEIGGEDDIIDADNAAKKAAADKVAVDKAAAEKAAADAGKTAEELEADKKKADQDVIDWEKELNDTKSDFGRKQKATDDKLATLTDNISQLTEIIKTGLPGNQKDESADFDSDEPIPLTMGELAKTMHKMMNSQNKQVTGEQKEYQDGYLKTVERLGSTYSDKIHQHIVERMHQDFNNRHSDNPALDAELNFSKAEATILREVRARKTNPLDKNTGKVLDNLGGSNNVNQDHQEIIPVKLDEYAAEFIKSTGMKEEDAQKALQGDIPLYLRGKVSL